MLLIALNVILLGGLMALEIFAQKWKDFASYIMPSELTIDLNVFIDIWHYCLDQISHRWGNILERIEDNIPKIVSQLPPVTPQQPTSSSYRRSSSVKSRYLFSCGNRVNYRSQLSSSPFYSFFLRSKLQ